MLSRMMLSGANVVLMDEPTNHLDLESISAVNDGVIRFPEVVLFSSHDHQFVNTVANRIVELTPGGMIDEATTFEEYLENPDVRKLRVEQMNSGKKRTCGLLLNCSDDHFPIRHIN